MYLAENNHVMRLVLILDVRRWLGVRLQVWLGCKVRVGDWFSPLIVSLAKLISYHLATLLFWCRSRHAERQRSTSGSRP